MIFVAISKKLAKKVIECINGGVSFTPPTNWYFGLCASEPVNDLIPVGSEPADGTGYKRKQLANSQFSGSSGTFTPADTTGDTGTGLVARVTNAQTIEMDEITSGDEPDIQYFFLAETPENSNASGASREVAMWGSFDRKRKLVINSNLIIEAGGAVFELFNVI
nr:MAG TPA: hypothetical protein [Caudoviricetes sp.]DAT69717.1 MAG TPA: hypothetical protein [Caudoviricetes sp.]